MLRFSTCLCIGYIQDHNAWRRYILETLKLIRVSNGSRQDSTHKRCASNPLQLIHSYKVRDLSCSSVSDAVCLELIWTDELHVYTGTLNRDWAFTTEKTHNGYLGIHVVLCCVVLYCAALLLHCLSRANLWVSSCMTHSGLLWEKPNIEELIKRRENVALKLWELYFARGSSLLISQVVQNSLTEPCKCWMMVHFRYMCMYIHLQYTAHVRVHWQLLYHNKTIMNDIHVHWNSANFTAAHTM